MDNFFYHVPTDIYFGKGQISHLGERMAQLSKKVLLVYGGGSIKRIGLYDEVIAQLKGAGIEYVELSGVEPNPRITSVRRGVELCREHGLTAVLAVGGGSTIDCGKMVAAGVCYEGDAWDLVLDRKKLVAALPIAAVLTNAATGSEMDAFAVISDMEKNEKWGSGNDHTKPVFSILDPTYSMSLPAFQTASGASDIMSHTFENYFNRTKGALPPVPPCRGCAENLHSLYAHRPRGSRQLRGAREPDVGLEPCHQRPSELRREHGLVGARYRA